MCTPVALNLHVYILYRSTCQYTTENCYKARSRIGVPHILCSTYSIGVQMYMNTHVHCIYGDLQKQRAGNGSLVEHMDPEREREREKNITLYP